MVSRRKKRSCSRVLCTQVRQKKSEMLNVRQQGLRVSGPVDVSPGFPVHNPQSSTISAGGKAALLMLPRDALFSYPRSMHTDKKDSAWCGSCDRERKTMKVWRNTRYPDTMQQPILMSSHAYLADSIPAYSCNNQ